MPAPASRRCDPMPTDSVLLTDAARAAITAAAHQAWPREMVGLVGGTGNAVTAFHRLPNVAIAGDRFAVAPAAFSAGVAAIERRGDAFLGFVHSHPAGGATLSAVDRRELWRDCLQFVIGLDRDGRHELACFALVGDALQQIAIHDPLTADGFAIHDRAFSTDERIALGNALEPTLARDTAAPIGQAAVPMIVAIGIDSVAIARIEALYARGGERFLQRVFTPTEQAYCLTRHRPGESFAARFCAKEAVMKCLGTGWADGLAFRQIEIERDAAGAVEVRLHDAARDHARRRGIARIHLSLTHTLDTATAFAVAEG